MLAISVYLRLRLISHFLLEGASLTVTKVNARKLLKDNDIDWWFAPLTSMGDIGTADLISKLLSLHHQGAVSITLYDPS